MDKQKVSDLLTSLENQTQELRKELEPVLDELGESRDPDVYGLSAYALSAVAYAYLKSEGQDTELVEPELQRVKELLQRLDRS